MNVFWELVLWWVGEVYCGSEVGSWDQPHICVELVAVGAECGVELPVGVVALGAGEQG